MVDVTLIYYIDGVEVGRDYTNSDFAKIKLDEAKTRYAGQGEFSFKEYLG